MLGTAASPNTNPAFIVNAMSGRPSTSGSVVTSAPAASIASTSCFHSSCAVSVTTVGVIQGLMW